MRGDPMSTGTNAPQTPTLPESPDVDTHDVDPLQEVTLSEYRVELIPLDDIYVDGPEPDEQRVREMVESIREVTLHHPIGVVLNDIEGHPAKYRLVVGN